MLQKFGKELLQHYIFFSKVIETTLCMRLFELARVDMPFDTYISQKQHTVVKALMGPAKRHTPEVCLLFITLTANI